ncbi:multidrug efflux SMR transporter [Propioniferax innocua]
MAQGAPVAWTILMISGMFEAVWAAALSMSAGFTRLKPTLVFIIACCISMGGLSWAMMWIPAGTAYAVWSGTGAVLAVVWAIITRQERITLARTLLLGLLIGSIVGLKAVS